MSAAHCRRGRSRAHDQEGSLAGLSAALMRFAFAPFTEVPVELAAAPLRTAMPAAPDPAIEIPGAVVLLVVLVELALCAGATAADPARHTKTVARLKSEFMVFLVQLAPIPRGGSMGRA